ncbi:hypothetical protein PF005_g14388 [Phytophthora fragariae]|uniref:Uncharacterized protein n=2 Tax=Phytophthora fragariae TaxID=53985 RepID=A0A6A3KCP9_9STRA|nr:hypothetical protein PF003_g25223 [Phytophthora fragariae]KAE9001824.1 hypothetical protein PF011_g13580 [Phytophthora fragariae]KAE9202936.1 hypothetical protein PF005_g14388 [Phytophthora fragariae]KAE9220068.1 hypothetical protein PF002_g15999 [Phytophthora fragariae]KAE9302636.1 hypothetical protein PF001_g13919 [Phytophthora fragariae]
MAKKNGAWLDKADEAAVTVDEAGAVPVMLDEHGNRQGFEQMDLSLGIKNSKHFRENFQPDEGQVHVLVVLPHPEQAASTKKQQRHIRMSTEVSCIKFLDLFTEGELAELKELDLRVNVRIHDGNVATTSKGKSYVILPHTIFTGGRVDFYKGIVVNSVVNSCKAGVVPDSAQLEVKDEDE